MGGVQKYNVATLILLKVTIAVLTSHFSFVKCLKTPFRVSKSSNHAVAKFWKISENLQNWLTNEQKTWGKKLHYFVVFVTIGPSFLVSHVFM